MSGVHTAVVAEAAQADYFRACLQNERFELDVLRAKHVKNLTKCMTEGEMRHMSDVRRCIRTTEDGLRAIDRMLAALDQRFPDDMARRGA